MCSIGGERVMKYWLFLLAGILGITVVVGAEPISNMVGEPSVAPVTVNMLCVFGCAVGIIANYQTDFGYGKTFFAGVLVGVPGLVWAIVYSFIRPYDHNLIDINIVFALIFLVIPAIGAPTMYKLTNILGFGKVE
jgi:drug/metabolite transporter (DMT)-like permease